MTTDLSNATGIELVNATYDGDDVDWISVDRWTKYGKDRVYMNGLKTGDGWISLKDASAGGDRWTKVTAEYELDGDLLTIRVGHEAKISHSPTHVITLRLSGEEFEAAVDDDDEDENNDEPEIVADGGEDDLNTHTDIDESTIEETADDRGVDAADLADAIEDADQDWGDVAEEMVAEARDIDESGEYNESTIITESPVAVARYIDYGMWDPAIHHLQDEYDHSERVARAVRAAHQRQAERDGADANVLGTMDAVYVRSPAVCEWMGAGLSLPAARVAATRAAGNSQTETARALGLSGGAVRSHDARRNQRVREARRLVELAG